MDHENIPSFGNLSDISGLYELVVQHAPDNSTLLEIGCFHGRSLVHLGLTCKAANRGLKVFGVDWGRDMSGNGADTALRNNVTRFGLDDTVRLIFEDSNTAHRHFQDGSLYFVFVDGAHDPHEAVAADVKNWMPKVQIGGYLAGHDYRWWTVCEPVSALIPVVLHDTLWDDCWLAEKQDLIQDGDIHKPTTIPKDPAQPSIREYFQQRYAK